jgi:ABC-type antimicrobial peptide transport system permease subunit
MEGLFELKNNVITFSAVTLMIPEFSYIWNKDTDRDKMTAKKELAYVYFMCDYNSMYNSYPPDLRIKKVGKDFMGNENYIPIKYIEKAIQKYSELQDTPVIKSLKSVKKNLEITTSVLNTVQEDISKNIEIFKKQNKNLADDDQWLETMLKNLEKISKIITTYPTVIKMMSELEVQARRQELEGELIRGGGEVGDYEMPESMSKITEQKT